MYLNSTPVRGKKYRFERKYFINKFSADVLKQRLSLLLTPDAHTDAGQLGGGYLVSSLYFDDFYNTSFHQKQHGILLRNKLRIRYYNRDYNFIRLEHKHKNGEFVSKESVALSYEQYDKIRRADYSFALEESSPVWRCFYTRRQTVGLRPVVLVEYARKAFTYTPGNVRVTFDSALRAALPFSDTLIPVMPEGQTILELKYDAFLPAVVSGLLAGIELTQMAVSKYVFCREKLLQAHMYAV